MNNTTARLATRPVTAAGAQPNRWLGVLHGIYGAGRNWRAVAGELVAARPEWGTLLIDLREHGESAGFDPPHTLERTAADLVRLEPPGPLRALLGHSFGGKIALLRGREDPDVDQIWVVDSTPASGAPEGSAWAMLDALRAMPDRFGDREAAVTALSDRGFPRPVGLWMSANLEQSDGGYRWRLDLDAMESLLQDFFRTDLWALVEEPRPGLELHFIRATESSVLGREEAERIRIAGRQTGRVFLHDVPGGHWLNADNPDRLVELIGDRLP
jgi:pimeloyl-ACP methyl ester carboxylesterase